MKNTFLLLSLLVSSSVVVLQAQADEKSESCYKAIERLVNGSQTNEEKDWKFKFQTSDKMANADGTEPTKPPTQYRKFNRDSQGSMERYTLQVFENENLGDQKSLPASERIVKRYEITHFSSATCTDIKSPNCHYVKSTFEMLGPKSAKCFKKITEKKHLANKDTDAIRMSSKFCATWGDWVRTHKKAGDKSGTIDKSIIESFLAGYKSKDLDWRKELGLLKEDSKAIGLSERQSIQVLRQANTNCESFDVDQPRAASQPASISEPEAVRQAK